MTIYALSSGPGISGIAVIRVSGKNTEEVIKKITGLKKLYNVYIFLKNYSRSEFNQNITKVNKT